MKIPSLALLLAVLPAFGGQPGAQLAPFALYTQFQQEPSASVLQAMRQELASIMAPMGLRFDWRPLSSVSGKDVAVELAVMTFKGRCDAENLLPRSAQSGRLGWTHVSEGAVLPFSDIDCDGVREFLQASLLQRRAGDRDELYGRAIGRVLAHELYHILGNTQHHGSKGVAKAAYTVANLLGDDFEFGEKEAAALLTSKAHELLATESSK
jgi:hypothetical protein